MEGDSLTLHTNITEIQRDDDILWVFITGRAIIAKSFNNFNDFFIYDVDFDGRFRDRLQVNNQTGDLTITHITTEDSGLYQMDIRFNRRISSRLNVTVYGVVGDEVKSVSVMEGDSLTLHTDTEIQTDDLILWRFGPQETLIAQINRAANKTTIYDDERFRDRLQVNYQTGDLIITNITTQHTGLYQMIIIGKQKTSYRFNVTVYVSAGVVGDEVKSVPVMEGDSVTLHTHITEIKTDDRILWSFGPQKSLIAKINREANIISIYDDVLDGRFRDRLQLNDQTGDLIITNITSKHTGLYQVTIYSKQKTSYRFSVTVYDSDSVKL
nr:contactin-4-like [Misgurnus anguillicaudatus]